MVGYAGGVPGTSLAGALSALDLTEEQQRILREIFPRYTGT